MQIETQSPIKYVDELLHLAIAQHASDIHLESFQHEFLIRMRIDGLLQKVTSLPTHRAAAIISRSKILANLDITETRLPQDGHFTIQSQHNQPFDCRISSCGTQFGEKIVLRLLNSDKKIYNLNELGLSKMQEKIILKTLSQPQGLIIITGPTGSGKTQTLYTLLNLLNQPCKNIMTAEDPIEIQLKHINQVNVQPKIGLGFAAILKSFLRCDPDIIMLGEIRDQETAEIALRAAQTGHLVLTTLHTRSASETIARLQNFGIASYNIASCLNLIIAQRLVRKLCQNCKTIYNPNQHERIDFNIQQQDHIYNANHCNQCQNGYRGRVGVFECLPINNELIELINTHATNQQIKQHCKQSHYLSLWDEAITKLKAGITSTTEVYRVIEKSYSCASTGTTCKN